MVDWNSPLWMAASAVSGLGALNWGLEEFAEINLVTEFIQEPGLQAASYAAIGVAGALLLYGQTEKVIDG
jgi:uncharacterized membrane protein YuzA (DUF378 family)